MRKHGDIHLKQHMHYKSKCIFTFPLSSSTLPIEVISPTLFSSLNVFTSCNIPKLAYTKRKTTILHRQKDKKKNDRKKKKEKESKSKSTNE